MSTQPRRYKKRTYKKRSRGGRKLTSVQKSEVKRIIQKQAELKYLNVTQPSATAGTTATILSLTGGISQGNTDNQRNGDQIRLQKAYLRLFCQTAAADRNYFRFIIFQWIPEDTTQPVDTDILLAGAGGSIDYTSQYNHDKRKLFKIIHDVTYTLVGNASNSYMDSSRQFHQIMTPSFPRPNVIYNAGAVTACNAVYFLAIGDGNTTAGPTYFFTYKIMYTDI